MSAFDGLLWDLPVEKGRRQWFNPKPPTPATGWKRPTVFPDLSHCSAICWDYETKDRQLKKLGPGWGRHDPDSHIIGLSVYTDDGFNAYYPVAHEEDPHLNFPVKQVRDWQADQMRHRNIWNLFHNGGYDLGWALEWEIEPAGKIYDTWYGEKLLICSTSRQKSNSGATLEETGQRRIGQGKRSVEILRWIHQYRGRGMLDDEDLDDALKEFLYLTSPILTGPYAEVDTKLLLPIADVQVPLLQQNGLWEVFEMECDLISLINRMRFDGVSVNQEAAEKADVEVGQEIITLQSQLDHAAGCHLEVTAPDKIGKVLADRGHKVPRTAKTDKYSVKDEWLETVEDPLVEMIVDLKELRKFHSTFIQGHLLGNIVNGRIYGTLKPFGTITGRFAHERPNLGQIPSKNPRLMKVVRSPFVPDPGHHKWRKNDYSQLQCRILAHFATGPGSDALREEYNAKPETNYHKFCHGMILRLTGKDLPYKNVKTTSFQLIFGSGNANLARKLRLSREESGPFFDAYHDGLPYVRHTLDSISREISQRGYSLTILGRRVEFDLFENRWHRYTDEDVRKAYTLDKIPPDWGAGCLQRAFTYKGGNYTIQGSEADLMKKAMWRCMKDGVFDVTGPPKLSVHDELDWSVRDWTKATQEAFAEAERIMRTAVQFSVPILTSCEEGPSWGEVEPI